MIYAFLTLGFLAAAVLLAFFEQLGVPQRWIGYGFLLMTVAFCAFCGKLACVLDAGKEARPEDRISSFQGGTAIAGGWISAGMFVGLAGTLFLLGYDGLAFVLGCGGGFALAALAFAPALRRHKALSLADFLAERYEGRLARASIFAVLVACTFLFLAVQLYAAALVSERLARIDFTAAVLLGAAAVLLTAQLGGTRGVVAAQAALCTILILAYLTPAFILSGKYYGIPLPELTYGQVLTDISNIELEMLKKRLADARTLKPHLQPFINFNWLNFLALVFCLMLGTAAMPHVMASCLAGARTRAASASAAWALLLVSLLLVTAPAYAAFSKREIYSLIEQGTPLSALPSWIYAYGQVGLVKVCGSDAIDPAAVAAACAKVSGTRGLLRHGDLSIDPDAILMAAPEIAGLPYVIAGLIAAGGLAAALSMSAGLLNTMTGVLPSAPVSPLARLSFCVIVAAAAFVAWLRPADLMTMVAWAFSLAAAGILPALALGLWWRRTTGIGAALGMLAGFGVCAYYVLGTRYFAPAFFELWGNLSNASFAAAARYHTLKQVWLAAGPETQAAIGRALDVHAQSIANWWGIKNTAAAIFGLPVGLATAVIASLLDSVLASRRDQPQVSGAER